MNRTNGFAAAAFTARCNAFIVLAIAFRSNETKLSYAYRKRAALEVMVI